MMLLSCPCLNVKIYAKDLKQCVTRYTDFVSHCGDKQLAECLSEVKLENPGITFEHSYLVHREAQGQFQLYQCLSCNTKTHVQCTDSEQTVLVNTKLQSDQAVIERLKHSPSFSEPFGIILQKPTEPNSNAPDPRTLDSLETHLNEVQQQLNRFLLREEQAVEDRIRNYEEEQRAAFQQLKDKTKADKRKMISVVLRAAEASDQTDKDMDFLLPHNQRNVHRSSPSSKQIKKQMRPPSQSFSGNYHTLDSEAMFMLDEIEPLDEPFYESDENEDISPMKSRDEMGHSARTRQDLYSTSVPISVPMWGKGRHPSTEDEDEDQDNTPSDPDQIADRMQALAESITDTGRYIFGDRPRPRMNTGDFVH